MNAVECFSQNARSGCLADSARSDEKIGVGQPILLDRVLERTRDVFLADEVVECLWPVFSRKNLVAHGANLVPRARRENTISAGSISFFEVAAQLPLQMPPGRFLDCAPLGCDRFLLRLPFLSRPGINVAPAGVKSGARFAPILRSLGLAYGP